MLLAAGAAPKARSREGFEALHCAALTGNPDLVREAVLAYLRETDAAFERRLPALAASLASVPDFELRMHWAFTSWIPLVSRLLPSDTFTIYKRGTSLRLDSTLLAMNGLTWERGALSLVVWGADMPRPGATFVLDHDMQTACDARLAFTAPEDVSQQDWVRKLLTKPFKVTDYWSRDARIVPTLASGGVLDSLLSGSWLGLGPATPAERRGRASEGAGAAAAAAAAAEAAAIVDAPEPANLARADVGVWAQCGCYELRNLCVRDVTHTAILPEAALPLRSWWKPAYSRQVAASAGAAAASAGYASGEGAGAGAISDGSGEEARPSAATLSAGSSQSAAAASAHVHEEVPEARLALLQRALRAIREGRIDELAGARDASALEGMWAGEAQPDGAKRKVAHTAPISFADYFGLEREEGGQSAGGEAAAAAAAAAAGGGEEGGQPSQPSGGPPPPHYEHSDGKLHKPQVMLAEFKPARITTEDKNLDLKMFFCKEFPLTVRRQGVGCGCGCVRREVLAVGVAVYPHTATDSALQHCTRPPPPPLAHTAEGPVPAHR